MKFSKLVLGLVMGSALLATTGCSMLSDLAEAMPLNDEGIDSFEINCVDVAEAQDKLGVNEMVTSELKQPFDLGDGAMAVTGIVSETDENGNTSLYATVHYSSTDFEMDDHDFVLIYDDNSDEANLKTMANDKGRYYFEVTAADIADAESCYLKVDGWLNEVYITFDSDDITVK